MKPTEPNSREEEAKPIHVYDDIEEMDHPIPRWFQALFYGTTIFGVAYFIYYEIGNGVGLVQEYERHLRDHEYALYERAAGQPRATIGEAELVTISRDVERVRQGKEIYVAKCASCHGASGQGSIGPNLTDAYWLYGAKLGDIAKTIRDGVPDKGMPPWGALLSDADLYSVTAYVRSVRGAKVDNAKAPQGDKTE